MSTGHSTPASSLRRLSRHTQLASARIHARPPFSLPTSLRGNPRLFARQLRRHRLHRHALRISPRGSPQRSRFHAEIRQRRAFPPVIAALPPIGAATCRAKREFPALRGVTCRMELSPSRCRHFARHSRHARGVSPRCRRASPDASRHPPARGNHGEDVRV